MTKTYSEIRQNVYFKAAVDLYKLVVTIADENIDDGSLASENVGNRIWAGSLIESTFKQAVALEDRGHEQGVASAREERWVGRHRAAAEARTAEGRALKARIIAKVGASA